MRTVNRHNCRTHRRSLWSQAGRCAAVLSTGLLCSCASTGVDPSASLVPPVAPTAAGNNTGGAEGVARVAAPPAGESTTGRIQQTNYQDDGQTAANGAVAQFSAADARVPLPHNPSTAGCPPYGSACSPYGVGACPPYAVGATHGIGGPIGFGVPRPDEFLCDGGDRMPPVHYDRTFRHGLDTEDTIGEWTDPAGGRHVTPSNKVCVYAPRYGEVRSFGIPVAGTRVERLVSANEVTRGVGLNGETLLDTEVQRTMPGGARVRTRASGLAREQELLGFDNAAVAALNLKDVPPVVDTAFLHRGVLTRGEEPFLAKGIQAAVVWTRTQNPVISAVDVSAQEVRAEFRASEMIGLEDKNKPGILRVIKLADRSSAAAGEVVTFTIRYDNLGDKPVEQIRIVDNLTPRLELVENSATTDRPGRLDVEPNGEGSFVLTFVIEDALPGKTGGVVTFQARVR